jgi:hypothetical protein
MSRWWTRLWLTCILMRPSFTLRFGACIGLRDSILIRAPGLLKHPGDSMKPEQLETSRNTVKILMFIIGLEGRLLWQPLGSLRSAFFSAPAGSQNSDSERQIQGQTRTGQLESQGSISQKSSASGAAYYHHLDLFLYKKHELVISLFFWTILARRGSFAESALSWVWTM